ncbi:hydrogen peroxide-inducible genes activator [Croceibacter atlanticus]|jgi:LysR family hydrogen peroxide-inducible transcriptional activator|uniref:Transcriptional regulator, LysR family protein n=1 Tax=Croceibacter atlanticus (strain ATCC BAA-628 / JCM 21780 / CIP 108009 / IAM 15332 / KCTC 12090 / HTCC2559) TaxID=216432 RepID=A3UC00_CROAH|nr:hydrogen peroxide-inducible genes activator [Croceibacter atlanticus]EAP86151.1 transcriptional regulator, LysR family protein [Croceibacter atlanticus HTCC2559]MAM22528.1 hydrogen peroxide-inducible genes activator [Croceibacter sp.]MBW4968987.1 LysR family transcriptional regulator [Croceibacter atlanticus]WSP33828.1 LysR substrate-binding domain-containing protein [Croceibacter atlanticus]|tara:strand:+ start:103960 stop:104898 length:939 start_codon:yes stop_codon:yes gene_type:complete
MTITQLNYVLAVAEHQNFTKAAQKVFVTQPTLSMQIQKLEDELDIQIFDRGKKPIELTDVGRKIVAQARNIVNESDRIKDIVDQQKGYIGGEFKIGVIPTIMPTLLPMFLSNFTKKYPKVKLSIEELHTEAIIEQLKEGHIDAAIAATPLEDEEIKERVLYFEPFVGYVPNNHRLQGKTKIDPTDLDVEDILLLQDGHCFKDGILNLCKMADRYEEDRFSLQSGSFETLIKLSNEGLGMTLLPYLHTLDLRDQDKSHLRMFTDPIPAREVSIIYHKSELKMQIIEALQSVIAGVVKGAITFQNVQIISPISK